MVTLKPRASRIAPKEAEAIPLPSEETTPPVININLVMQWDIPSKTRATIVPPDGVTLYWKSLDSSMNI
jgi:hypothetical protein